MAEILRKYCGNTAETWRKYGEFVYNAVSYRVSLPKEEFLEQLKEWDLRPVEIDGKLAAVVMVKENEVHVACADEWRGKWIKRSTIKRILGTVLEEYGQVVTRAQYADADARAFIERLGFVPDSVFYVLDKLRHVKEATCHQQQQ